MARTANEKDVTEEANALIVEGIANRAELPDELALDRVLNEFEGNEQTGKVTIWKVLPREPGQRGAGKDKYLDTMTPNDFSQYGLEGIQADFGEGEYRVKIHRENGDMMLNRIFLIGPLTMQKRRQIEARTPAVPAAAAPAGGMDQALIVALLGALEKGFTNLQNTINASQTNRGAFLAELVQYKQLFTPPNGAGGGAPAGDPFAMFKSALELVKELGPGGSEKTTADVFLELVKEFAPAFAEVAKGLVISRAARPVQLPPQQPAPPPAPQLQNQPVTTATSSETENMDMMGLVLKQYLPMLIAQARNDNNERTYAEMIADHVPLETIQGFVNRPDWFEYLAGINPGVREVAPWFQKLHAALVGILTEESQPGMNDESVGFSTLGDGQ
jgi:hypothetical protein